MVAVVLVLGLAVWLEPELIVEEDFGMGPPPLLIKVEEAVGSRNEELDDVQSACTSWMEETRMEKRRSEWRSEKEIEGRDLVMTGMLSAARCKGKKLIDQSPDLYGCEGGAKFDQRRLQECIVV